jgi:hypothetical protein
MAKRFAVTFFVVLGACIFLVSGFVLVLCLAPGFYALGVKYVAQGTHVQHVQTQIVKEVDGFNSSIIVETSEIPVYVVFTQNYDYEIEYYDNYNGFTTSSFDDPSVSITKDANGNAVIKTNEFIKFAYESSSSKRYLKVYIPIASVTGDSSAYRTNIAIRSNSSDITFLASEEDSRTPSFNTVQVETSGTLSVNTAVKATTFKYVTNNSIKIAESRNNTIDATNYNLESKSGRIIVETAVEGDITATTSNLDIKIVSCKNFIAKTGFGTIVCAKSDANITTTGLVNIETKSGSVYLGNIGGTGENTIKTGSGSVSINKIADATITTSKGNVTIKSIDNATISTNVGKVKIEEILESADISTKRGNVSLGGEGMTINNPKVFSRMGKVYVYSATGTVDIETITGAVEFDNTSSQEITIKSGGKLSATNLTGKVTINASKDTTLDFESISAETRITLEDTVKNLEIRALNNSIDDIKYLITGKNVTRYEDNGTGTYSKIESTSTLTNMAGTGPLFRVDSKNAEIAVYFKS